MADYLQKILGGAKSAVSSVSSDADDFADFATAASPLPPSHTASEAFNAASSTGAPAPTSILTQFFGNPGAAMQNRPFTKWYRVWERVTIADFYQEFFILPVLLITIAVNLWGSWANKARAKKWANTHLPLLQSEYAQVGFSRGDRSGELKAGNLEVPDNMLRQRGKNEYFTYATGRQNVAYTHVQLSLYKRYNPISWLGELILSFFADSFAPPVERIEATAYTFDGKEKTFLPRAPGGSSSSYDGFVFAIVHKDKMQQLRNDRYDLSLTATRDHAKLPDWATTMSESAEVTEVMLTPELLKAVEEAGEDLEALIVSDQPIDAPKKLDDTVPIKRVGLSMKLSANTSTALFQYYLRLPDFLVSNAHFRPEAMRRIKATRTTEADKIRKADEEDKAEERRNASDKAKKEERQKKLDNMTADEQKKFLEREKKDEAKKSQRKRTMRA